MEQATSDGISNDTTEKLDKIKPKTTGRLRLSNSQPSTQINHRTCTRNPIKRFSQVIVLSSDEEGKTETKPLTTTEIAKIYSAKLKKIEQIKPCPPPTSNIIIDFFKKANLSVNSDDDFDFRSRPKLVTTSNVKETNKRKPVKRKKDRNQTDIRKLIHIKRSKVEGENPVEMSQNEMNPKSSAEVPVTTSQPDAMDKSTNLKRTLERYGFKSRTNYENYDITTLFGPGRNTKNKRFKPTLLMRTSKERQQQLLEERVENILEDEYKENVAVPIHDQLKYDVFSFHLENFLAVSPTVFYVNSNCERSEESMDFYYTGNLFPKSSIKADYLLQNWANIPGREQTPPPVSSAEINVERKVLALEKKALAKVSDEESPCMEAQPSRVNTPQKSELNQTVLDNAQNLLVQQSALSGSCEDLFADHDEIICFETNPSEDEAKNGDEIPETPSLPETDSETNKIVSENIIEESKSEEANQMEVDNDEVNVVVEINDEEMEPMEVDENIVCEEVNFNVPDSVGNKSQKSVSNSGSSPSQISDNSCGDILKRIQTQLKALSDNIPDKTEEVPKIARNNLESIKESEECFVISSGSETHNLELELQNVDDFLFDSDLEEQQEADVERTLIYYDHHNSVYEQEAGNNFMDEIVNQTIQEINSSGSDTEFSNPAGEIPCELVQPLNTETNFSEKNDSFDDFDALIFGSNPKSVPVDAVITNEKSPAKECESKTSVIRSSIREKFESLSRQSTKHIATDKFLVKTRDVTPPPHYEEMDDIKIEWEMKKFGLKNIKRREDRVKILNHIYIRTHPFIEITTDDVDGHNLSLALLSGNVIESANANNVDQDVCETYSAKTQPLYTCTSDDHENEFTSLEMKYGLKPTKSQNRIKTTAKPNAKTKQSKKSPTVIEETVSQTKSKVVATIKLENFANPDESDQKLLMHDAFTDQLLNDDFLVLPVKQRGKFQWCPQPLHLAFMNLLKANPWFASIILQYKPFEIEIMYKYFKSIGCRYELSDLKLFFDRRCITFRSEG